MENRLYFFLFLFTHQHFAVASLADLSVNCIHSAHQRSRRSLLEINARNYIYSVEGKKRWPLFLRKRGCAQRDFNDKTFL